MKALFFDLDGTIVDSAPGIYASLQYAMKQMGRVPLSEDVLKSFIGPPLQESFKKLHLSDSESQQATTLYREYYRETGITQASLYPEMAALLQSLATISDIQLYLATSKPEEFAKEILQHFGLADYFTGIYGADMAGVRSEKKDVLAYGISNSGLSDATTAWMIGDRFHDVKGALANKVLPVGVLWGFGDKDELVAAGAKYIAATPGELRQLITEDWQRNVGQ